MPILDTLFWWLDGGSRAPSTQLAKLTRLEKPVRSLKVIGAGPGRTGTASLKKALETLGFTPCYHMFECTSLGHADNWVRALQPGGAVADELEEILDAHGFQATVDFPASVCFAELLARYPDAKVVLTLRDDPAKWASSMIETIWSRYAGERSWVLAPWRRAFQRFTGLYRSRFLLGATVSDAQMEDPAFLAAAVERWAAHVRQTVPPDRLLEFKPQDGWAPLCGFLGVPVPITPYPNENEGAGMKSFIMIRWRRYACFNATLAALALVAVASTAARLRKLRGS